MSVACSRDSIGTAGDGDGGQGTTGSAPSPTGAGQEDTGQGTGSAPGGSGDTAAVDDTSPTADSGPAEDGTTAGATPEACVGVEANYVVDATVDDDGLGPTNAPITVTNCRPEPAYVRQDCCYGPTYFLERQNPGEEGWHMSVPAQACDCEGPGRPLVLDALSSLQFDSCPGCFDVEPLCDVGTALYRWTIFVGPEPACEDCWEMHVTPELEWYCEG